MKSSRKKTSKKTKKAMEASGEDGYNKSKWNGRGLRRWKEMEAVGKTKFQIPP